MIATDQFNFIHVPKTGGQTVASILRDKFKLRHIGAAHRPAAALPPEFMDRPVIAAIRDPLTWYRSWHQFNRTNQTVAQDLVYGVHGYPHARLSLQQFVPAVLHDIENARAPWPFTRVMQALDCGPLTWYWLYLCYANPLEIADAYEGDIHATVDAVGQRLVTHVLRTETLNADLARAVRAISPHIRPKTLAHIRKKWPVNKTRYPEGVGHDATSEALVRHKERIIYQIFGYV